MESRALRTTELRCPYCKNIQKKLLPYIELPGVKQIHGVNFYDNTIINKSGLKMITGDCQHENCLNTSILLCPEINNKYYCIYHKYNLINEYYLKKKNEQKEKKIAEQKEKEQAKKQLKEDKEQAKQKIKDDKEKAKQKIKEDKEQAKKQLKDDKATTVKEPKVKILCSQILKSGKNAGTQCQCKAVTNNLCNRHTIISSN
jgi:hypothetical protein